MGVALAVALVGLAAFKPAAREVKRLGWVVALFLVLVVYLAIVSDINGADWEQRLLRVVIIFALAYVVAQGRYHMPSAMFGLGFAAVGNAAAFYAGLTTNNYPPFLTGFWGDKNVAGLWYAVVLAAGFVTLRRWYSKVMWLAGFGVLLFLTGSRTSIAAAVLALAWGALRGRVGVFGRWLLVLLGIGALILVEERYARIGVFADREGTDWFRELVTLAMAEKADVAPWYGMGLTSSIVRLPGGRWAYFHDSYLALRVEGGYLLVGFFLVLFVVMGLGLFSRKINVSPETLMFEAAVVVILVCAWKLGEVFFTSIAAIAIGALLGAKYGVPLSGPEDSEAIPSRGDRAL
ncbi:MAG: hypothetical protein Q4G35_05095 [Propionibacteriaceae bacterium]|nr:hypothetical protein [Propionibacteriaceae bacterium]